jgi:hypothetical protein
VVVTKSSELLDFNKFMDDQNEIRLKKKFEIEQLKNNKKELEDQIGFIQLKLSKSQELENIGMGFKELKTIYETIIELSKANNISPKEAIEKFFNDLNEYDDIISFKKKVEDLKKEAATLNTQITNNRATLLSQPQIGITLQKLFQNGILENDIEDINSILVTGGFDYDSDRTIINKKTLLSDLAKYLDIKLVIKSLEQKQSELTNNMTRLENQKENLQYNINLLILMMVYLFRDLELSIKKTGIALEDPRNLNIILIIPLHYSSVLKDDNNNPEENHEKDQEQNHEDDEDKKSKSQKYQ